MKQHDSGASAEVGTAPATNSPHGGIYLLLLMISGGLLLLLPWQAGWVETQKGWFIQPMVGSSLGLGLMAFFAALRCVQALQQGRLKLSLERLVLTVLGYRTALMCGALFMLYIESLEIIGFALATLLFISTLLFLSRLNSPFWMLMALLATVVLVLIFRVGVSVWMPDVWLYGLLPDELADFANQYL